MKKSILVLSALLTLVVSGICLQSCSSEYDEYTTEEYGYYTEEEIAEIEALAEKYDLNVEIIFNNYGEKKPIADFEAKFQALSQLKGEYKMIPMASDKEEYCISRKVEGPVCRATTTSLEKGSWSGDESVRVEKSSGFMTYYDYYTIKVSISWDLEADIASQRVKGSADISGLENVEQKISASPLGSESISFSGSVSGEERDNNNNVVKYSFSISNGEVNRKTKFGSFSVR